jgi:hypothetical protein
MFVARRVFSRTLVGLPIVLALAAGAVAQDKPDFSGRWVLVPPPEPGPDVPRALGVTLTVTSTTVTGAPMEPHFSQIHIAREFESGTESEGHRIGLIGGSVGGRSADGKSLGTTTRYSVTWFNRTLVFESSSHTGEAPGTGQWTDRVETWSLDAEGRLRITITSRSTDGTKSTTLVYRRSE